MGAAVILPAVGRAVLLGLVARDYGLAFDDAYEFAAGGHPGMSRYACGVAPHTLGSHERSVGGELCQPLPL